MPGTTKTRQELVNAALAHVGAASAGQTPSVEDFDDMDRFVNTVIDTLKADVVTIDPEEVPNEVFEPLSWLVANAGAAWFGSAYSNDVEKLHTHRIRVTTRSRPTYSVLPISQI